MSAPPRVSVIVTAHDEAEAIGPCLASLAVAQRRLPAGDVEVILVDDRSGDGTADRAREVGLPDLRVLRIDAHEPGGLTARQAALHRGFEAARGEVVFLTDADAEVPPEWLAASLHWLAASGADALAGPVAFRPAGRLIADLQTTDAVYYLGWGRLLARLGLAPGVLFGNFAVRRAAYAALGGFPAIGPALTEDLAFARALHRRGFRVALVPGPLVTVRACPTWRDLVHRARRTSRGGVSALSVALGSWALTLPALAVAALWWPAGLGALAVRWGLGAGALTLALGGAGLARLTPHALAYEVAAIVLGARVLALVVADRTVEWGGIRYGR